MRKNLNTEADMLAKNFESLEPQTLDPEKKKIKKKIRIFRKAPKTRYIFENGVKFAPTPSFYSFCLAFVLLAGAIGNLALFAKKEYATISIISIQEETREARRKNDELDREIANSYDLSEIEKKALTLGLKKPRPDQFIHIKID
jgi:hypothetical protein